MMQIGINEGWKLSPDSKVTDKGGFEVHFTKGEVATSALDLLNSEDPEGEASKILIFSPNMKEYGKDTMRSALDLMRDLRATYKIMYTIFNLYFTKDELTKLYPVSVLFNGLTITKENEATMLQQESVINKMFANLGEAAVKVIKENNLSEKEAFRIKLLRQSAKKAYPRFTYKPEFGVWVELMSVPAAQSKVEFTAFEKSKGYDDASIPTDIITGESDADSAFTDEPVIESASDEDVEFN